MTVKQCGISNEFEMVTEIVVELNFDESSSKTHESQN